jgi:hypothetical protein
MEDQRCYESKGHATIIRCMHVKKMNLFSDAKMFSFIYAFCWRSCMDIYIRWNRFASFVVVITTIQKLGKEFQIDFLLISYRIVYVIL